jgi:hypothetical protein
MRDWYFSDDRDLVKWGTLVHITEKYGLNTIIQVPYFRPEIKHPHFVFMDNSLPLPTKVWRFFRNIHDIKRLESTIKASIVVIGTEFNPKQRIAYISEVKIKISSAKRPIVLFLDPDTGLQPNKCGPTHTATSDIQELWPLLTRGEWLVLYQHARRKTDWRESVAAKVSSLCENAAVHIVRSADVGKDVAFICVQKLKT